MIRAIIFDLYGVLAINGWQAFKAHHFSDREAVWTQVFELGRQVDAGLAEYGELISFTAEQTGESESMVRYQLEHTVPNSTLLEYIDTTLKPKYRIGILSNASSNAVIDQILTPQQERSFDAITLSHHVGLTKPDNRMYAVAADRLGVSIEECLFIDDQERHARGARDAGMQALVYTDNKELISDLETLV
jgi:HAD superfamily hydrolase (TIGR01549 family)